MAQFNNIVDDRLRGLLEDLEIYVNDVNQANTSYNPRRFTKFRDRINSAFARYIKRRRSEIAGESKDFDITARELKKRFEIDEQNIVSTFEANANRAFAEAMHNLERSLGETLTADGNFGIFALVGLARKRPEIEKPLKVVSGFSRLDKNGRVKIIGLVPYLVMLVRNAQSDWQRKLGVSVARSTRVDLMRVSPQPSWLGPNADEVCNRWRDKIVSLTGFTPGFPALEQALNEKPPLFHPNCRHTLIPLTASEQQAAIENNSKTYNQLKRHL